MDGEEIGQIMVENSVQADLCDIEHTAKLAMVKNLALSCSLDEDQAANLLTESAVELIHRKNTSAGESSFEDDARKVMDSSIERHKGYSDYR